MKSWSAEVNWTDFRTSWVFLTWFSPPIIENVLLPHLVWTLDILTAIVLFWLRSGAGKVSHDSATFLTKQTMSRRFMTKNIFTVQKYFEGVSGPPRPRYCSDWWARILYEPPRTAPGQDQWTRNVDLSLAVPIFECSTIKAINMENWQIKTES